MTHNTREGIEERFLKDFRAGMFVNPLTGNQNPFKIETWWHQELQKAREEAMAREKQIKDIHTIELDTISCMSLERFVVWRDHRKQSELDQSN